jgi:AsmA protein
MGVWIRRVLIGLVGLIVLVVIAAAVFVASFDANKYKGVAIDWMKTHKQRTLVIDGPIELSMFPRLAMKVSKVTLSEAAKADNFAAIDSAGLAVDVLPLLRGEVVVGRVEAKGVRVTYLRDAKGKSNIDDLLTPEEPAKTEPASKPVRFDVSGIELADVKATVRDDKSSTNGQVLLAKFKSGRLANRVEAPVDLDLQFDFKQPALKGNLTGATRLTLDMDTQSASLKKMNLGFKGDAPGLSGVDVALKGDVAWDGTKKSVNAQDLSVKLSGHTGALKHDGTTLSIERFAFEPDAQKLDLRKLVAAVKASQAGQPVTLDLEWPELAVAGKSLSGSAFSGKLSRGGDMPLSAKFKSTAPSGSFEAVHLPAFEAQVESASPQRKLVGTLRSDLVIKPQPGSLALDKLDLQAKVEEPGLQPLALNIRGNALASAQKSNWNIAGQLNDNKFATEGSAVLAGNTPQINAKANFDSLDLNKLLSKEKTPNPPAAASNADVPVDLSGLRAVNAQVSVVAGRFAFQQYKVNDARIQATLDGGMLRITELQGKAWGGQLNATAFADARASRIAIKGAATGVDVNALVKDVAAKDWIEGNGRVSFDLDSAGRSVNELRSRLQGSAALQLRDGAVKGINLAKSLRQAKAALSMKQDASQKANQTEKTDFSELSASFQIHDGVARNKDLDMKSPFLRLGGEGAIDVGKGRIDYVARATVASTAKGQDSADLAALKGLTIPVRLTGPFEALDWKIEWSAIATQAATKQIEDKLSEKLGLKPAPGAASGAASKPSAADALKKGLKGLFK